MVIIIEEFLRTGEMPLDWSPAPLNPILKVAGDPAAKDLRPLVLQNTCLKWISATIALQLSDLINQITPQQPKGFIKGRFMEDHLFNAFGSWHDLDAVFCSLILPRPTILLPINMLLPFLPVWPCPLNLLG